MAVQRKKPLKPQDHGRAREPLTKQAWRLSKLVIEGVRPQLNSGRHAVKRIVGENFTVEADIYKDGHDLLADRVCYRAPGEAEWQLVPMRFDRDVDRWSASFELDRIGTWTYTVEARPDTFTTWRSDLEKWLQAGHEVNADLLEGALLVERAASLAQGRERQRLEKLASLLGDDEAPLGERAVAALSAELKELMDAHVDEGEVTRFDRELEVVVDRPAAVFGAWYEMFPRSQGRVPGKHGTFADAERRLPQLASLGYDVVYLPPIHPIGRTHRKGRNNSVVAGPEDPGSPWAIGDEQGGHTAVHPDLGTIEDFDRFVASARALGIEVALDYALQCSPDHPWVREHSN
jgi:starch synthase (maltosyl-transferring)